MDGLDAATAAVVANNRAAATWASAAGGAAPKKAAGEALRRLDALAALSGGAYLAPALESRLLDRQKQDILANRHGSGQHAPLVSVASVEINLVSRAWSAAGIQQQQAQAGKALLCVLAIPIASACFADSARPTTSLTSCTLSSSSAFHIQVMSGADKASGQVGRRCVVRFVMGSSER